MNEANALGEMPIFWFLRGGGPRVRQQFRQRGTLQPRTHFSGRRRCLTRNGNSGLQELLSDQPDAR